MRMWQVNPQLLCNKHLLGEHFEIHLHRHNFIKHHSITGRISPVVQIEPMSMGRRHNELALEMVSRGMNHNSPYVMPDLGYLPAEIREAKVDITVSLKELCKRCLNCKQLIERGE